MLMRLKKYHKPILIYCLAVMFLMFEMGVQVSPSVMTTQLMEDLHLNTFQLGLMSGFYFYTYTIMQIPSGLLFDHYNPRKIIATSILVCSLGAFLFSFSMGIYLSIFARLLMGLGSAFAFISVLVVSADLFGHRHFALLTGITQMLAAVGAMLGQIPLSYLVVSLGWREVMVYISIVGLLLAILVWKFAHYERTMETHQLSTLSQLKKSMVENFKSILSMKQTWAIAFYAFLMWAPMSGFASLWGIPYLKTVFDLDHGLAASICSLMWIGIAVASPILGWFSTKLNRRVLPLIIASLIGLVGFGAVILFSNMVVGLIALTVFLAGFACSGQALSFSIVKDINFAKQRGTAIAFNNMAVVISGAFFQPLIGKLLSVFRPEQSSIVETLYSATAFRYSLLLILACYLLATFTALFMIKETHCQQVDLKN